MQPNYKPFYWFTAAVLAAVIAFGVYVSGLTDCNKSAIGPLECHKLYLAFGVLFSIVILLSVGAGLYALLPAPEAGDPPGKAVFDGFLKVLPPIATLVLGYYFGSTQATSTSTDTRPTAPTSEQAASAASAGSNTAPKK